jgi:hypothetical protein
MIKLGKKIYIKKIEGKKKYFMEWNWNILIVI